MPSLTLKRHPTKKQRAMKVASTAAGAAQTWLKAKIAWIAGKKAAKVAAPAVAVGTAAVMVKKQRSHHEHHESRPPMPAGVA